MYRRSPKEKAKQKKENDVKTKTFVLGTSLVFGFYYILQTGVHRSLGNHNPKRWVGTLSEESNCEVSNISSHGSGVNTGGSWACSMTSVHPRLATILPRQELEGQAHTCASAWQVASLLLWPSDWTVCQLEWTAGGMCFSGTLNKDCPCFLKLNKWKKNVVALKERTWVEGYHPLWLAGLHWTNHLVPLALCGHAKKEIRWGHFKPFSVLILWLSKAIICHFSWMFNMKSNSTFTFLEMMACFTGIKGSKEALTCRGVWVDNAKQIFTKIMETMASHWTGGVVGGHSACKVKSGPLPIW